MISEPGQRFVSPRTRPKQTNTVKTSSGNQKARARSSTKRFRRRAGLPDDSLDSGIGGTALPASLGGLSQEAADQPAAAGPSRPLGHEPPLELFDRLAADLHLLSVRAPLQSVLAPDLGALRGHRGREDSDVAERFQELPDRGGPVERLHARLEQLAIFR